MPNIKFIKKHLLLYVIINNPNLESKNTFRQIEQAIMGGATIIQLREKNAKYTNFLKNAKKLHKLCKKYHLPFIINDNLSIAKKIKADGIHIGQNDESIINVRKQLGKNKIIGVSVQTLKQAKEAYKNGANYLGVGAIFPTTSKHNANYVSLQTLKSICNNIRIPIVAIGGINKANIHKLSKIGISGVAFIKAIFDNSKVFENVHYLKSTIKKIILK